MILNGENDYVALDLRSLRTDLSLTCDLYIKEEGQYVLYREASLPFTPADRERLLESGVSNLWVRISVDEDVLLQQHLTVLLSLPDEEMPPLAKAGLLYSSVMGITRRAIAGSLSKEILADVDEMVGVTVDYLTRSQTAFPALLCVMLHDFSVYTHSLNVAVYALGLGKFLGVTDHQSLRHLGVGAILHDVGKARVPKDMLSKRGKLSPEEWAIMRQHPEWGTEILSTAADLEDDVLAIIAQHHERLDGSGYPRGLTGEKIQMFAMIVALVDAYDAMTCGRPYRKARMPFDALSLLKTEMHGKLDPALVPGLVHFLGDPFAPVLLESERCCQHHGDVLADGSQDQLQV
ncbi:MAG: HD domain-containing protein [Chloroflexi bacterium]|nr:HD domain-containing protein [Chloroflexota bacterium]